RACGVSGQCWAVGAGRVARAAIVESLGWKAPAAGWGIEEIAANLERITDLESALALGNLMEASTKLFS
ncbi:MAG TPA: 3-oxoacyl-ACP reductase, partial [bacterium]|nr:3-oxoacyl-ACP reductase [bacterium]